MTPGVRSRLQGGSHPARSDLPVSQGRPGSWLRDEVPCRGVATKVSLGKWLPSTQQSPHGSRRMWNILASWPAAVGRPGERHGPSLGSQNHERVAQLFLPCVGINFSNVPCYS